MVARCDRCRRFIGIAALLVLAGCGTGGPRTYRIPGKLVYEDGSAVPGASVVLQTSVNGKNFSARGMATPDGKFTLTTLKEGDGIVAGDHQISISPLPVAEGSKAPRPVIPEHYWDFTTSGLTTNVTPQTHEIVVTISRTAKK